MKQGRRQRERNSVLVAFNFNLILLKALDCIREEHNNEICSTYLHKQINNAIFVNLSQIL